MYKRDDTVKVRVGKTYIGGDSPVSVQSMLSARSDDIKANVEEAKALEAAGCEIIRVTVPNKQAVRTVYALKEAVGVPIVADIHFDYKLAIESVAAGVDKVRINPGNIGSDENIKAVVASCRSAGVPIRIGVNSGSIEKHILKKHGAPTAQALLESGLYHISLLERFDFEDIVLSLKSSDTKTMYDAYVLAAEKCRYPLHLGVTEAGTQRTGIIKSAAGIGGLLLYGIGNTIRVSLTDNPVKEVEAADQLLRAIGLKKGGVRFISCPTCGRTGIDLITLARAAEERLSGLDKDITIAIMGCVVNGPGEAQGADIGIAGGDGCGVLFKKGEIIRKIPENQLLEELIEEVKNM